MSLDILDQRITRDREQAQTLISGAEASYDRARANTTLSDQGKQAAIAATYLDTTQRVAALKTDETTAIEAKRQELTRALFGTLTSDPTTLIAYRDAQDRAARLDSPAEAAILINRALLNSDDTLSAAVLERSVAEAWTEAVDAYTAAHPDQGERLADLMQLSRFSGAQTSLMSFFAYVVPIPNELTGLQPTELQALATR